MRWAFDVSDRGGRERVMAQTNEVERTIEDGVTRLEAIIIGGPLVPADPLRWDARKRLPSRVGRRYIW